MTTPPVVPLGSVGRWDQAYTVVSAVFSQLGSVIFGQTYLGYLVIFVLLASISLWLWRVFKGL